MLYLTYIKKSNCTKHELERRPHRQTADDTAEVPIVFRKTSLIKKGTKLILKVRFPCC